MLDVAMQSFRSGHDGVFFLFLVYARSRFSANATPAVGADFLIATQLCRRHHRLKHSGNWTVTRDDTTTITTWTDKRGRTYRTRPPTRPTTTTGTRTTTTAATPAKPATPAVNRATTKPQPEPDPEPPPF